MKPSVFRVELHPDTGQGVTVDVLETEHLDASGQPSHMVIFSVTINVCDEDDARRRALADAARFLHWYMRPI